MADPKQQNRKGGRGAAGPALKCASARSMRRARWPKDRHFRASVIPRSSPIQLLELYPLSETHPAGRRAHRQSLSANKGRRWRLSIIGQEATAVGSAYALRPDDFITPIIRDLGAVFVKGIRPREIFAQYMAKAWGPSGGKDLNVHFGYMDKGFIGPISHLGDMIPVMTGILLGARMQKKDVVGLAYIGDGARAPARFMKE